MSYSAGSPPPCDSSGRSKLYRSSAVNAHAETSRGTEEEAKRRLSAEPAPTSEVWLNIAFSASGLRLLTAEAEVASFADAPFKGGMAVGAATLGDGPTVGWLVGGAKPVDLVIVLAGDVEDALRARARGGRRGAGGRPRAGVG